MNPYLEHDGVANDFHHSFIVAARAALVRQLPDKLLGVINVQHRGEEKQCWVEIRDRDRKLFTVIEALKPPMKAPGPDRDMYLARREQWLSGNANLIEIDLFRGGLREVPGPLSSCDYVCSLSRGESRLYLEVWPILLRGRLPTLPVPLSSPDEVATLDLKQVIDEIYDSAHYEAWIYDSEPSPPLAPEDAAWARQFVPQQG
jgi:hypothetical protein